MRKRHFLVMATLPLIAVGIHMASTPSDSAAPSVEQQLGETGHHRQTQGPPDNEPADRFALVPVAELDVQIIRIEQEKAAISKRLQEIALDHTQGAPERRAAIAALGNLGDDESLGFLARHVDLMVAPGPDHYGTAGSTFASLEPCAAALTSAGWKAIPAILQHLEHHEGGLGRTLVWSRSVLEMIAGTEAARTLLEAELQRAATDMHRENLQEMLRMLSRGRQR